MKDQVGYTWQLVLSSQREHRLLFPGSNQILTRVTLFGTDTRVWFSPLVQPPKQVGRIFFDITPDCQCQRAGSVIVICGSSSPFWPIFLAFTSAHLDYRLLVPSDWASFIPLVLLIRLRCASAVLSLSSFCPAYTI